MKWSYSHFNKPSVSRKSFIDCLVKCLINCLVKCLINSFFYIHRQTDQPKKVCRSIYGLFHRLPHPHLTNGRKDSSKLVSLYTGFLLALTGILLPMASNSMENSVASQRTVLIVGDSLSAGYGIPLEKGWVQLLRERLHQQKFDYQVINASISGDTSHGARSRFPDLLTQHHPAIVLIEIGGNDGLRGQSVKVLKANLEAMITAAKQQKTEVVLLGIELPFNFGPRYTKLFTKTYQDLASQYQLAWVPSFMAGVGDNPQYMQNDGIHPNVEGQSGLLENVWPVLEPLLLPMTPLTSTESIKESVQ